MGGNAGGGGSMKEYLHLTLAAYGVKHRRKVRHGDKTRTRRDLCKHFNPIGLRFPEER